jgi:hypothetical protein
MPFLSPRLIFDHKEMNLLADMRKPLGFVRPLSLSGPYLGRGEREVPKVALIRITLHCSWLRGFLAGENLLVFC